MGGWEAKVTERRKKNNNNNKHQNINAKKQQTIVDKTGQMTVNYWK